MAATPAHVRAYVEMFGLAVSDEQVDELSHAVQGAFDGLAALWRYDLDGVDSAVQIPTEGRR